jgi:type II secretory pathway pseudopilin PulG
MIVVIGILTLLISLLIGAVMFAQRRAEGTRIRADMQTIAMALEQYRADFGKYPMRASGDGHILAWALIGPGPATEDGVDGPGFRAVAGGKIYPSYLQASFSVVRNSTVAGDWNLIDFQGHPIEYYPKRGDYGLGAGGQLVGNSFSGQFRYEVTDGSIPLAVLQSRLGDWNKNNVIDRTATPPEELKFGGPFFLASPGSNGAWEDINNPDPSKRDSDDIFYELDAR